MRLNYDPAGDHSLSGFDRFGRVVDQLWQQYDAQQLFSPLPFAGEGPGVRALDRYQYGYDPAGNRVWKMNAVAHDLSLPLDELYEYDELARLVAARRGLLSTSPSLSLASVGFEQAWGLDGLGNFATFQEDSDGNGWDLEQERDVNAANEIAGIDEGQYQDAWITPEYDAAGNMIVGPAPGDETARLHFVYDAWNRLVKVYADDAQNPGEPGDVVAQYTYDGQKRRIEKALADGTSVEYYYNANWQLLEERFLDESQEPAGADQYVWSPRYIDAPILRDRYDDEGELDAAARLYYLGDANFNVTALVGLEEVEPDVFEWRVAERYAYDPYGKTTVYDADWANPVAPTADGPLYAGYRFDAETGLHLARNRLYHSTLATWTTRDPLGYAAGDVNLYRYCASHPTISTDATGTSSHDVLRKWWNNGRLPKAWGADVSGSAVFGTGATAALQVVFFGDTCEIGLYGIAPGAVKPVEAGQIKGGKDLLLTAAKKFFLGLPWGYDVSVSANFTIAERSGSGPADAKSWQGVFYGGTFGGSLLGKASVGAFVGENIKKGDWVGVHVGAGLSATPGVNAKTNPQYYYRIASLKLADIYGEFVGQCVCYEIISVLP